MTGWRNSEEIKKSLDALAARALITDNLADRLIGNARAQRAEVVPLRSRRRLWLVLATAATVVAIAVGVVALAGSAGNHAAPPAVEPSMTAAPSQFPSNPSPSTAVPLPCAVGHLQITSTIRSSQSGDSISALLVLTNEGKISCTLSGYPTVVAVDHANNPVTEAVRVPRTFWGGLPAGTGSPGSVLLRHGDRASAIVSWSAAAYGPHSVCVHADHIQVIPPDSGRSVKVAISTYRNVPWRPCDIEVTPVVHGTTGSE